MSRDVVGELRVPGRSTGLFAHTRETYIASFRSRLSEQTEGGCREWTGRTYHGYGIFHVAKCINGLIEKSDRTHRIAWVLFVGPIPDGLYVCHRCNNKRCCNVDHLYLATHQQNTADAGRDNLMGSKGSGVCKKGHFHGNIRGDCPVCRRTSYARYREKNREKRREWDRIHAKARYWKNKALSALTTDEGKTL